MTIKSRQLSFAVFLLVTAGCKQGEEGDIHKRPQELILLPGAYGVDYRTADGVHGISYEAPIAYPADNAIRTIANELSARGYRPLKEHPMNPGVPSAYVRGWVDFVDATRKPEVRVYQWIGDWLGAQGEWLEYSLAYEFENGTEPNVRTLKVVVSRMPKTYAEQAIAAAAGQGRVEQIKTLMMDSRGQPVVYGAESPRPR